MRTAPAWVNFRQVCEPVLQYHSASWLLRAFAFLRLDAPRLSAFALCCAIFASMTWMPTVRALAVAGRIKGTVSVTTTDPNARPALLAGARLTLVNRDVTGPSIKAVTDDAGNFAFTDLPAATYVLTAEADGLQSVTREIRLTAGDTLIVDIELTATVSETVTVREEEGLLSRAETTTSNVVRAQTLKDLPLRAENYQSALLLTPGAVHGADGLDHLKGARAGQSAYTVNGVDVTDPTTGNLAFDIPVEAAASVQIAENPYSAEFGRLTGGAINLETRGGDDKFKFTASRFFPTFRHILVGQTDSFRPRLTLSGPIVRDKLFFLQSVEYRFSRTRVPSLVAPGDDSTSESFNSFTQFDLSINRNNHARLVTAFFPQKARYVGLNTFNSQQVTPNIRQSGFLFSISEQAIFSSGSFLASAISYKSFDVDVFGQGEGPLTLLPDGNTGNYFAASHRRMPRLQWQETYYAHPFKLGGQQWFKAGIEFDHTDVSGRFRNNSILIRRRDNTLVQRIDFAGMGVVGRGVNEFMAFVQDKWIASPKLTIDAGLRLDRDGITRQSNLAPRLSFMFVPLKNNRTIVRGGLGLFYDRTPLSVGYFTQMPERVVTTFAHDGLSVTDGPVGFENLVEGPLRNARSVRWNLQLDRGITKNLTMRVGYLKRSTTDDLIVNARVEGSGRGGLIVGSMGHSRYRELQLVGIFDSPRVGNWSASYVWSNARGDLNTIDNFLGDLPAFVVRANEYGPLPFDAPHRFLTFGRWKTRYDITVSPSLEIRSGFPFSYVDERLDFIGARNQAGRYPTFISLDAQVTKGFAVPKFETHRARIGIAVLNIMNNFNPSDIQNNIGSPRAGSFFNSLGRSVRGKFEMDF